MISLENIPKVKLGNWPTPLYELKNFGKYLMGPKIFIKRDDLCGLLLGGNKVRGLEYVMADALKKGARTIVSAGGSHSNQAALTVAAACKIGLLSCMVLSSSKLDISKGNILLMEMLGAKLDYLGDFGGQQERAIVEALAQRVEDVLQELKELGQSPYLVPYAYKGLIPSLHPTSPYWVAGYASGLFEIKQQAEAMGVNSGYIVTTSCWGPTVAGLSVGNKLLGSPFKIIGINAGPYNNVQVLEQHCICLCEYLGISWNCAFEFFDGYGTREDIEIKEAMSLIASTEGLLTDPVYSGRGILAIIELIRQKRFDKEDNVIFIHTGGIAGLFP